MSGGLIKQDVIGGGGDLITAAHFVHLLSNTMYEYQIVVFVRCRRVFSIIRDSSARIKGFSPRRTIIIVTVDLASKYVRFSVVIVRT